jgi:hypothetical protein
VQEKAQKLKEAFAILTQGVEMVHHECTSSVLGGVKKTTTRKIVWMVSESKIVACLGLLLLS